MGEVIQAVVRNGLRTQVLFFPGTPMWTSARQKVRDELSLAIVRIRGLAQISTAPSDGALTVYARALEDGVEKYLVGHVFDRRPCHEETR